MGRRRHLRDNSKVCDACQEQFFDKESAKKTQESSRKARMN
ncbi:MAG: hypothetical protein AABX47_07250 [Nanoarchaeota archaeon]